MIAAVALILSLALVAALLGVANARRGRWLLVGFSGVACLLALYTCLLVAHIGGAL